MTGNVDRVLINNLNTEVTIEESWLNCLDILRSASTTYEVKLWLEPLKLINISSKTAFFSSDKNQIHASFVLGQFQKHICSAFNKLGIEIEHIKIDVLKRSDDSKIISLNSESKSDNKYESNHDFALKYSNVESKQTNLTNDAKRQRQLDKFDKRYSFDSYYTAEFNSWAYDAAKSISEDPKSSKINPFIVYGNTGLGKTHLLKAIARRALELHVVDKVCYIKSNDFINDCVNAIRNNTIDNFKKKFLTCDILLIDDIQFLRGKESINILYSIVSKMIEQKNQVVISCDQLPQNIVKKAEEKEIYSKLLSRFEGGVTQNIEVPSIDSRVGILKNRISNGFFEKNLNEDILKYLALGHENVRTLEGVLTKIKAYTGFFPHEIGGSEVSYELVCRIVKSTVSNEIVLIKASDIIESVAKAFEIDSKLLSTKSRVNTIVVPRQIAMYLCHKHLKKTEKEIGFEFNRDHSTVNFSVKKVKELMANDKEISAKIQSIEHSLNLV